MWKALVLASGMLLATTAGQAAPLPHAGSIPAATVDARGLQTVQYYGGPYYRHDRGHHYGWYKHRWHKNRWHKRPRHDGWYGWHRPPPRHW